MVKKLLILFLFLIPQIAEAQQYKRPPSITISVTPAILPWRQQMMDLNRQIIQNQQHQLQPQQQSQDPAILNALNQIALLNQQILNELQRSRPPVMLIHSNPPLQTLPQQQLPIQGQPLQQLPIAGTPQQQLPIQGTPQQQLPIQGQPQQQLPIQGQPQQQLPQGQQLPQQQLMPPANYQRFTYAIPTPYYGVK